MQVEIQVWAAWLKPEYYPEPKLNISSYDQTAFGADYTPAGTMTLQVEVEEFSVAKEVAARVAALNKEKADLLQRVEHIEDHIARLACLEAPKD